MPLKSVVDKLPVAFTFCLMGGGLFLLIGTIFFFKELTIQEKKDKIDPGIYHTKANML